MPTELPFHQADEFESELLTRDISDDARRLLLLFHSAANGSPDPDLRGQFRSGPRAAWLIVCTGGQQRLAELAGLRSDRHVRQVCDELSAHGCLTRVSRPIGGGGSETYYAVFLQELLALPKLDLSTPIGRALHWFNEICAEPHTSKNTAVSTGETTGKRPAFRPADDRQTTGVSTGHVHAHENKTHEHEACSMSMGHESLKDSGGARAAPEATRPVRFTSIPPDHVRQVVGQTDRRLFALYWSDLIAAGWARDCEADRIQLAALWHQVARLGRARNPGGAIAAAWRDRETRPLQLSAADEDWARRLLRPTPQARSPAATRPLQRPISDEPTETRRQQMLLAMAERFGE